MASMTAKDWISMVGGIFGIFAVIYVIIADITSLKATVSDYETQKSAIGASTVFVSGFRSGKSEGTLEGPGLTKLAEDLKPTLSEMAFTNSKLLSAIQTDGSVKLAIGSLSPRQNWTVSTWQSHMESAAAQEVFSLGPHNFCALSHVNEREQSESGCTISGDQNEWKMEINNAQCQAICFSLTEK